MDAFNFIFRPPYEPSPLQADEDGNVDVIPLDVLLAREASRARAAEEVAARHAAAAPELYAACEAALEVLPAGSRALELVIAAMEKADGV